MMNEPKTFGFEKLEVYKESLYFANRVYELSKNFPQSEAFGITNQMRRAAISVAANIAEGSSRSKKEYLHFLSIALGSCYECIPFLEICRKQNYVNHDEFQGFIDDLHRISAKLSALKNSLRSSSNIK